MWAAHGILAVGATLPGLYTAGGDTEITTSVRIDVRKVVAVIATPYDPGVAGEITRYYSSLPYMTKLTDTPAGQRFEPILENPYRFLATLFSGSRILARSIPSLGDSGLLNTDNALDEIQAYHWGGRSWDVYVGDEGAAFATFELVWPGKTSDLKFERDRAIVPLEDVGKRFNQPAQGTLYTWIGGTSNSLVLDGSGDKVDFGDVLDRATSSVTLAVAFVTTTAQTAVLCGKGLAISGAAGQGYALGLHSGGNMRAECGDGVTQFTANATPGGGYDDGAVHWAALVIDKTADLVRAYFDGAEIDTTSIVGMGTVDNADAFRFGTNDAGAQDFTGRILKVYISSAIETPAEVAAVMDDKDFNGHVFSGSVLSAWPIDEGTGTSVGDIVGALAGTITGALWYGQREGGADVQGKPKPFAYGKCNKVKPTQLDPLKRVFQCGDETMQALLNAWDQGAELGGTITNEASEETFWTGAGPSAPDVKTHLALSLVRFGAAPVGEITLTLEGSTVGGYSENPPTIQRSIAANRAGVSDPTGFDTASYSALGTAEYRSVRGH